MRAATSPVRAGVSQLSVVIVMRERSQKLSSTAASLDGNTDASGSNSRSTLSNSASVKGLSDGECACVASVATRGPSESSRIS